MNLKTMAVYLLGISAMSPLSAAPALKDILQHKSLKQQMQANGATPVLGYTDFSGTWSTAKCMGHEFTLEIANGIDFININGQETVLGVMTTNSNSGYKLPSSTLTNALVDSAEWNADRTKISFKTISVEKSFADPGAENTAMDTAMHVDMDFATLEMENGQLTLKMNNVQYVDAQRIDLSHPTCVFTKVE